MRKPPGRLGSASERCVVTLTPPLHAQMAACAGSLRSSQGGAHRSAGRAAVERLQDVLWMDEHGYMWFLLLEFPKSTVDVLYSSWGVGGGLVPRSSVSVRALLRQSCCGGIR